MNSFVKFALAGFILAYSSSAGVASPPPPPREIELVGQITAEKADATIASFAEGASRPILLRVDSTGGNAEASLRLARAIRDRGIEIRVRRVCATSCALYLVPAAKKVSFDGNAIPIMAQMPSPQLYQLEARVASQQTMTAEQKATFAQRQANFRKLLEAQGEFYRSLGIDPSRVYRTMDLWMRVNVGLGRNGKDAQKIGFVPDQRYLAQCLGFKNVSWRTLTPADSIAFASLGKSPVATVVGEEVYFEGKKVPVDPIAC